MTLSTLPPPLDYSTLTYREHVIDLHLSLSSILSSMFFMQMDWLTSRGLPCGGSGQMLKRGQLYSKLVGSWQSLTCLYLRSLPMEEVVTLSPELQANLARIMNINTSRYTSCEMKNVRDCVLLSQSWDVLERMQRFYIK